MSKKIDLIELAKAHVHYGHLAKNWDSNFAPYVYKKLGKHHIIDLRKTAANLVRSCDALTKIIASGRKVLFVSTKKQVKQVVAEAAEESGMPYVTERWLGGMLTNLITIRKAVKKMTAIDRMKKDGTFETLSKRERLQMNRQREKLEINLGSISEMTRLPGALFVIDIKREHIAVKEAKRLGIPVFAIVDSNSNPNFVDFPIPANDDVSRSVSKILEYISFAIGEGKSQNKAENSTKEKTSKSSEEIDVDAGDISKTTSLTQQSADETSDEVIVEKVSIDTDTKVKKTSTAKKESENKKTTTKTSATNKTTSAKSATTKTAEESDTNTKTSTTGKTPKASTTKKAIAKKTADSKTKTKEE